MELTGELVFAIAVLICCTALVAYNVLDVENFMKVVMFLLGAIFGATATVARLYLRGRIIR